MSMTEALHDDNVDGTYMYVMLGRVSWKQPVSKIEALCCSKVAVTYAWVRGRMGGKDMTNFKDGFKKKQKNIRRNSVV